MKTSRFGATEALLVGIGLASVFYVYRIGISGFAASPFRLLFPLLVAVAALDIVSGRFRVNRRFANLCWILVSLLIINAFDYFRLNDPGRLGVNIFNHLVHLAIVPLVVVVCRDTRRVAFAAKGLIGASVFCLFIDAIWLWTGQLPFPRFVASAYLDGVSLADVVIAYEGVPRLAAAFFDPSFYGMFIVLVLAMLLLNAGDGRLRWYAWVLFVFNMAALVLTMSRTSYVGLVVLLIVSMVLLPARRRFLVWLSVGSLFALAVGLLVLDPDLLSIMTGRLSESAGVDSRTPYHLAGIEAWRNAPWFGMGSEGLLEMQQKYWFTSNSSAHMVYLTLLAKYGVVGFVCYMAFLMTPVVHVFLRWKTVESHGRFLVLGTLLPLIVMYLAYDHFWTLEFQYIVFGLVYAVAVHDLWQRNPGPDGASP